MGDVQRAGFVSIGVGSYRGGLEELRGALVEGDTVLVDPTERDVRRWVAAVRADRRRVPLIVAWSGRGTVVDGDLRLLAADSGPEAGLSLREFVLTLADSGASQLLVIVDACVDGGVVAPLFDAAIAESRVWAGVLVSCRIKGWAAGGRMLTGDALGDALARHGEHAFFARFGEAWSLLANPSHEVDEEPEFVGRTGEVRVVTTWVRSGRPGLRVLTGSSGTGKSAILARVALDTGHALLQARDGIAAPHDAVLLVDGLDEVGPDAVRLLVSLAASAVVVVAARSFPGPAVDVLDLDDPGVAQAGLADLRTYVATRLKGVASEMDPDAVAERLVTPGQSFLVARLVTDRLRAEPVDTSALDWQDLVQVTVKTVVATDLSTVVGPAHRRLPEGVPPAVVARQLLAALPWGYGEGFAEGEWLAVCEATALAGVPVDRRDLHWVLDQLGRYVVRGADGGYRLANDELTDLLELRPDRSTGGIRARVVATALLKRYRRLLAGGVPADEPGYLRRYAWRHAVDAGAEGVDALHSLTVLAPSLSGQVAVAELELAALLWAQGRRTAAVLHTERAVALYRRRGPTGTVELAAALHTLGTRLRGVGRSRDAVVATQEALRLHPDPATRSDLGVHLRDVGQPQRALAAGRRAVEELRGDDGLARALVNLGVTLRLSGRTDEAATVATEAVELCRLYAAPDLGEALTSLSACLRELGRRAEATAAATEAVELYRPGAVPEALILLSACLRDQGRHSEAYAASREAVELLRHAVLLDPAFRAHLGAALAEVSACLRQAGRLEDALDAAREATGAHAPAQLAACLDALGDHPGALAAAEEAVLLHRAAAGTRNVDLAVALTDLGVLRRHAGLPVGALAVVREAAERYREAAAVQPGRRGGLADALRNLGDAEHDAGNPDASVAATEEAVGILRRIARDPGSLTGLAAALATLCVRYGEVGRDSDAVAAGEEAVERYRDLATGHRALAAALDRLGVAYGADGRVEHAVVAAEEAVALSVEPDLAGALHNLGLAYARVGRAADAVAAVDRAVELLVPAPLRLPELARALSTSELLAAGRADPVWARILAADPANAAELMLARAAAAEPGDPRAAGWLAPHDTVGLRAEVRRHRTAGATAFDSAWVACSGEPVPAWFAVDEATLRSARAWVTADPVSAARGYLLEHPALLDPAADPAVDEALCAVEPAEAEQLRGVRAQARLHGVVAAYRPLVGRYRAQQFADAVPARQRLLLARYGADLADEHVRAALTKDGRRAALALLDLAALGADRQALDALDDPVPDRAVAELLLALATTGDVGALRPAAVLAGAVAESGASLATALFYEAVASAVAGDGTGAVELVHRARAADPDRLRGLVGAGALIAQRLPATVPLLVPLTREP